MYYKVYFILAHKNPDQIKDLISLLDDGKSLFFIHVDKKIKQLQFEKCIQNKAFIFIKNRVRCSWGTFSLVQATINAMVEINQFMTQKYSADNYHFIMLSGEDLPLKNNEQIHKFLENKQSTSFIHYWQLPYDKWWNGGFFRLENIYLFEYKKNQKLNYWINKIVKKLNFDFILPLNRLKKSFSHLKIFGNSQWMILTQDLMTFIIEKSIENRKLNNIFKYVLAPDELYFSTLILNFLTVDKFNIENKPTHLVSFEGVAANPVYLNIENINSINNSDTILFARKFDYHINQNTIDFIKQNVLK